MAKKFDPFSRRKSFQELVSFKVTSHFPLGRVTRALNCLHIGEAFSLCHPQTDSGPTSSKVSSILTCLPPVLQLNPEGQDIQIYIGFRGNKEPP